MYKYILDTNEHSHETESEGCNNNDKRTCKLKLRSDIRIILPTNIWNSLQHMLKDFQKCRCLIPFILVSISIKYWRHMYPYTKFQKIFLKYYMMNSILFNFQYTKSQLRQIGTDVGEVNSSKIQPTSSRKYKMIGSLKKRRRHFWIVFLLEIVLWIRYTSANNIHHISFHTIPYSFNIQIYVLSIKYSVIFLILRTSAISQFLISFFQAVSMIFQKQICITQLLV